MKFRILVMTILLFAAACVFAQDQGPMNTPRINSTYYVGSLSGLQYYPTIQSAVADACSSGGKSVVDIPPAYTGVDSISGVTGGCTNTVIKDEHNGIPTSCYTWNSTTYTATACVGIAQGGTGATTASGARTNLGVEASLGNPSTNGYVLSSSSAGVRSWIANGSASMTWPSTPGLMNCVGTPCTSYATSLKLGTLTGTDLCTYDVTNGLQCTTPTSTFDAAGAAAAVAAQLLPPQCPGIAVNSSGAAAANTTALNACYGYFSIPQGIIYNNGITPNSIVGGYHMVGWGSIPSSGVVPATYSSLVNLNTSVPQFNFTGSLVNPAPIIENLDVTTLTPSNATCGTGNNTGPAILINTVPGSWPHGGVRNVSASGYAQYAYAVGQYGQAEWDWDIWSPGACAVGHAAFDFPVAANDLVLSHIGGGGGGISGLGPFFQVMGNPVTISTEDIVNYSGPILSVGVTSQITATNVGTPSGGKTPVTLTTNNELQEIYGSGPYPTMMTFGTNSTVAAAGLTGQTITVTTGGVTPTSVSGTVSGSLSGAPFTSTETAGWLFIPGTGAQNSVDMTYGDIEGPQQPLGVFPAGAVVTVHSTSMQSNNANTTSSPFVCYLCTTDFESPYQITPTKTTSGTITGVSVAGTAVTVTATNTCSVGQWVGFSGLTANQLLNGQGCLASTGTNSSQIVCNGAWAAASSTTETTGNATCGAAPFYTIFGGNPGGSTIKGVLPGPAYPSIITTGAVVSGAGQASLFLPPTQTLPIPSQTASAFLASTPSPWTTTIRYAVNQPPNSGLAPATYENTRNTDGSHSWTNVTALGSTINNPVFTGTVTTSANSTYTQTFQVPFSLAVASGNNTQVVTVCYGYAVSFTATLTSSANSSLTDISQYSGTGTGYSVMNIVRLNNNSFNAGSSYLYLGAATPAASCFTFPIVNMDPIYTRVGQLDLLFNSAQTATNITSVTVGTAYNSSLAPAPWQSGTPFAGIVPVAQLGTGTPSSSNFLRGDGTWAIPAGSGTVTSVGWTGGIVSVATATTTPAFTIAGTSGGHPYFSSATTWASTSAGTTHGIWLAEGAGNSDATTGAGSAGQPLLSGGASADPAYGTLSVPGGGSGLTTLTAHAVQVGEGTSTPAQVGPDATTTHFLASGGSSADPAFRAIATADIPTPLDTRTVTVTDIGPVTGDDGLIVILDPASAVTLTRFSCGVTGTTSVITNLVKGGASLIADMTATAGDVNTVVVTTWANGSSQCGGTSSCAVAAHAPVTLHIGTISGTPTSVSCALDYTVN